MFFVHRSNCDLVNMLPVAFWMIGLTSSMCAGVTLDFCLSTCLSGSHIIHHIGVDLDIGTSRGEQKLSSIEILAGVIWRLKYLYVTSPRDVLVPLGQMKSIEKMKCIYYPLNCLGCWKIIQKATHSRHAVHAKQGSDCQLHFTTVETVTLILLYVLLLSTHDCQ